MVYDKVTYFSKQVIYFNNEIHMGGTILSVNYVLFVSLLSVLMVTWSQNEPSEGWGKNPQLTSTLRTVMAWLHFYYRLAQFITIKNLSFLKSA